MAPEYIALLAALPLAALVIHAIRKRRKALRRRRLLAAPFPDEWEMFLQKDMPLYSRMPPDLRDQLRRKVNVFMAEKNFEGCGGMILTDEARVTIAGYACMLLLNRETDYYPKLDTILVYPEEYVVDAATEVGGQYAREKRVHLGESWDRGVVVLEWDDLAANAEGLDDGINVAVHEFAHQLDQEDGLGADGVPVLEGRRAYAEWTRVLGEEFERLKKAVDEDGEHLIDEYGAQDPAEFFAVASETFFEWPLDLRDCHPRLYERLSAFYKLDPASWDWSDLVPNK